MKSKIASHSNLEQAIDTGPPPKGNLAIPILRHGTMEAEIYTPVEIDSQTPHSKDEIYVVARGSGEFYNGSENIKVQEGTLIFVPAGVDHRFVNFTSDLAVWVIFYGPEGGEKDA